MIRESDLVAEIDQLRQEVADLTDQCDALKLQCALAARALRQIAETLENSSKEDPRKCDSS